jgi:hypothetical protein
MAAPICQRPRNCHAEPPEAARNLPMPESTEIFRLSHRGRSGPGGVPVQAQSMPTLGINIIRPDLKERMAMAGWSGNRQRSCYPEPVS